jgi:hypothetical protein
MAFINFDDYIFSSRSISNNKSRFDCRTLLSIIRSLELQKATIHYGHGATERLFKYCADALILSRFLSDATN